MVRDSANKYMLHYLTVKVNSQVKKCDLPFPWLVKTNYTRT